MDKQAPSASPGILSYSVGVEKLLAKHGFKQILNIPTINAIHLL
jgi:hypothetical protein